jgi:hypothetical protein
MTEVVQIERNGERYIARDGERVVWSIELHLNMNGSSFREEIMWPAASVVAIGGGDAVHLVAVDSGTIARTISLGRDLFGHFGEARDDVLYILGWRNVVAVDRDVVRWVSHDVAVDGITWRGLDGDRIMLSAEMDPPGGWVDVELDAATGREVMRSQPRR